MSKNNISCIQVYHFWEIATLWNQHILPKLVNHPITDEHILTRKVQLWGVRLSMTRIKTFLRNPTHTKVVTQMFEFFRTGNVHRTITSNLVTFRWYIETSTKIRKRHRNLSTFNLGAKGMVWKHGKISIKFPNQIWIKYPRTWHKLYNLVICKQLWKFWKLVEGKVTSLPYLGGRIFI